MSEDLTQNLPPRSFEERVIAEFAALNRRFDSLEARATSLEGRLTSLEEKVDARLHDTRPMWEAVQERLTGIEKEMNSVGRHLKSFAGELGLLSIRVEHLENDLEELKQGRS